MLRIDIAKHPDGSTALRCTRENGSVTWQKQTTHAAHFVLHDLTHYAVETTLGYRRGFFGLIAEGWDAKAHRPKGPLCACREDTTGKGARGHLPVEAVEVEQIVGLFDSERGSGTLWTTDEFNAFAPRSLTDADIQTVRHLRGKLFQQWFALEPGQKLELKFG